MIIIRRPVNGNQSDLIEKLENIASQVHSSAQGQEAKALLNKLADIIKDKLDKEMCTSADTPFGLGRMRGLADVLEVINSMLRDDKID